MLHTWSKYTDGNGASVRVILFDYRKAFDLIDHTILTIKLGELGLPNISARHEKKLGNLNNECTPDLRLDREKWVINLSSKPLSSNKRAILEKGPKFAPTPHYKFPTRI
jgi:hypothetical protein